VKIADYIKQGQTNLSALAEEVLKELPDQIVDYMVTHGVKPNIVHADAISQIGY